MTSVVPPLLADDSLPAALAPVSSVIERALAGDSRDRVIPREVQEALRQEIGRSTPAWIAKMALVADCVRVVEAAVTADGPPTGAEIEHVMSVLYPAAGFFSKLRGDYQPFAQPDEDEARAFLEFYARDEGLFGKRCARTEWLGLGICYRVAKETGDFGALDAYEVLIPRLADDVIALGGVTTGERLARQGVADLIALRRRIAAVDEDLGHGGEDPRIAAFCDPRGPTVFSATAHGHQVWERDPFDVESVHTEARGKFEQLIDRAGGPEAGESGRILLVLGHSGAGKTHLMRAFRSYLHDRRAGYAGYMQMSSLAEDYARYALGNLLFSLERPYDPPEVEQSGLMALSDAVAETPGALRREDLRLLREGDLEPGADADFVSRLVDDLLVSSFSDFDPDLLRALLYLQRRDPRINSRVSKYLRCEPLTDYDRRILGGIAPRTRDSDPQQMLEDIGRLMWASEEGALVLLIDQLEDLFHQDESVHRFRRSLDVLRSLSERLPSAVIVIACLEDVWEDTKGTLTQSVIDRLERDPAPARLSSARSRDEIETLVAKRLEFLYDALGVRYQPDQPCFPIAPEQLDALTNLRARDVLDWCRQYQERCEDAGGLAEPPNVAPEPSSGEDAGVLELERDWNDLRSGYGEAPPDDDRELLSLLTAGVLAAADELGLHVSVDEAVEHPLLRIEAPGPDGLRERLIAGFCNKAPQGGGLLRQLNALSAAESDAIPALIRGSEYPSGGKSKTAQRLGELVRAGARKVVIEDSDWRAIMAFQELAEERAEDPVFAAWQRAYRPLSQLKPFHDLLQLDRPEVTAARTARDTEVAQTPQTRRESRPVRAVKSRPTPPAREPGSDRDLAIGRTPGIAPEPVSLPLDQLKTHAAVLGQTGSGKTTLALSILEQVLARGVPVIAVDRKGDLAGYARSSFWDEPARGDAGAVSKQALRDAVAPALYTPGAPEGNALSIPVIPRGMADAPSRDRDAIAKYAAAALGAMMDFKETEAHKRRRVVLMKAIELLGSMEGEPGLAELIEFIDSQDPALINAIGRLDKRVFGQLVESLDMLRLERDTLLAAGPPLDCAALLGRAADGRTPLRIISTKFLGDRSTIQFWVARLLMELSRWASRAPSNELQAVLFLDEADLYMPATGKPVSKEPLMDLIKRARSAGLGILLATQNPGDFDYRARDNIGTWFLGKVGTDRARQKMQPLLSDARFTVSEKLASLSAGEFFVLAGGDVQSVRAHRALLAPEQMAETELIALARRQAETQVATAPTEC